MTADLTSELAESASKTLETCTSTAVVMSVLWPSLRIIVLLLSDLQG